ncbi:MAG: class I fructose-bisphosphate aldolase [Candidatus Eisenbacteria bacterium]|nr:class I fructose-bisphosphate aldolase [Candidatus Eisenbacteria bacterium]
MTSRVREILSWYSSENPGTKSQLARMMNSGKLAGTGQMVILPVDQGFEHGPARSFAMNPAGYDPRYHAQLAIDSGCNAYAAPLGFLEAVAGDMAGEIPLILKLNNHESLFDEKDPLSVQTGSIDDALRLGCSAIGYTIYPGSSASSMMYSELRELSEEARSVGLAVVVWSYPRGSMISKEGETALDVVAYAAHIAAQLGAHIIKVKLPGAHLEQPEAKKAYEKTGIPLCTLTERVRHVVQASFDGRRIVIFSGGAKKDKDDEVFDEARAIRDGGGFGSIIGRNSFQRPRAEAIKFLGAIMDIYKGESKSSPAGDSTSETVGASKSGPVGDSKGESRQVPGPGPDGTP